MYRRVQEKVAGYGLDAYLAAREENVNWLCQKENYYPPGVILITAQQTYLFTPSRNISGFRALYPEYQVLPGALPQAVAFCRRQSVKTLGYESNALSADSRQTLRQSLPQTELRALPDFIEDLRMIKTADEVEKLQAAAAVSDRAFLAFLKRLRPGQTEREARNILQNLLMEMGADGLSFEILLSSGARCYLPHAVPTEKRLEKGDFVLVDFGVRVNGYCSDTTRTVCLGKADALQKQRYELVRRAQESAVERIRAGMSGKEADALARDIISAAEPAGCYDYGLGHGIGMLVHEKPRLGPAADFILQANTAVSVEPGFYLPGWGGIRIEDIIVVKEHGRNLVMSKLSRELIEL